MSTEAGTAVQLSERVAQQNETSVGKAVPVMPLQRVRVFIATSLDGFIADRDNSVEWLHTLPPPPSDAVDPSHNDAFNANIGAILMGRKCYDTVMAFGLKKWPYAYPTLVASHRPLQAQADETANVARTEGPIAAMLQQAKKVAVVSGKDVYVDGGSLIRQALDEGLVDEIVVSIVPIILGDGVPLFAGVLRQRKLTLVKNETLYAGMVQLTYTLQPEVNKPPLTTS